VSFAVPGEAYDRYVGRYSRALAPRFADFAGVDAGAPVLELGCGTGALTAELAARHGARSVAAVDPADGFVDACRARVPGADVRVAAAEDLPFADGAFGGVLSQLVLTFVRDPERVLAEARRVSRPGGIVAGCTWEADGFAPARAFWAAALRVDPTAPDDARLPLRRTKELVALWERAGLREVETAELEIAASYASYDDLWSPLSTGGGPVVAWLSTRPEPLRARLRELCFEALGRPAGEFTLTSTAIAVRGRS